MSGNRAENFIANSFIHYLSPVRDDISVEKINLHSNRIPLGMTYNLSLKCN